MKFLNILLIALILNQIPAIAQATPNPKNMITVRGLNANEKEEIQRQVEFYSCHLGLEGVNIMVSFTYQMPEHVEGYTIYKNTEASKSILIKINKKLKISAQELTLAHEMIHVRQFVNGELVHHGDSHFTWKGKDFKNIRHLNYKDREWEEEAFSQEKKLLKAYRSHLSSIT